MDLFGVGMLEVIAILVIALLVLGPVKTMNMARGAGRMIGEVRRAMGDLSRAVEEEEREIAGETRWGEEPDVETRKHPEGRR